MAVALEGWGRARCVGDHHPKNPSAWAEHTSVLPGTISLQPTTLLAVASMDVLLSLGRMALSGIFGESPGHGGNIPHLGPGGVRRAYGTAAGTEGLARGSRACAAKLANWFLAGSG